jgi:LAO/AO transport system kinase
LANSHESAVTERPASARTEAAQPVRRSPKPKHSLSTGQYIDGILGGSRSILAKAITLIESSRDSDRELAEEIIERCLKASGDSVRVGVTGVPGAVKSSLIDALGKHVITNYGEKVAVLAVDPSSRISGGSILGDKTRMSFLGTNEKAFIRPSPSRGAMGGVAQHTREAIVLCEAAGYRNIFVETVGVGQSEVAVRDMVDFFLLVAIPGAGDELQGIKRGVMEMADAVVVNKADGDNVRSAERARSEAENALHYLPASASGWIPPALMCSAHTGAGISAIWSCVREYERKARAGGWLEQERREQNRRWMQDGLEDGLMQMFRSGPLMEQRIAEVERRVLLGEITPVRGVRDLLSNYADKLGPGRGSSKAT